MKYPEAKCPICSKKPLDLTKSCKNVKSKAVKCVSKHSQLKASGTTVYKCINYEGHGYSQFKPNIPNWYEVFFYDKLSLNDRRYKYQDMNLFNYKEFYRTSAAPILAIQSNLTENRVPTIVSEFRDLSATNPIVKYFQINYPAILDPTQHELVFKDERHRIKLMILLLYLCGCSQVLIASILGKKSRGTIATILIAIKKEMQIKDFSLNRKITYNKKHDKIILTDYYNEYSKNDFTIINKGPYSKVRQRYENLYKSFRRKNQKKIVIPPGS